MEDFSQGLEVSEHLVASLGGVPLSLPITGGILPHKISKGEQPEDLRVHRAQSKARGKMLTQDNWVS